MLYFQGQIMQGLIGFIVNPENLENEPCLGESGKIFNSQRIFLIFMQVW